MKAQFDRPCPPFSPNYWRDFNYMGQVSHLRVQVCTPSNRDKKTFFNPYQINNQEFGKNMNVAPGSRTHEVLQLGVQKLSLEKY